MNRKRLRQTIIVLIFPSMMISLMFYVMLGHRRDYLGHYAAGYGGTLCAIAISLACLPGSRFEIFASLTIVACTITCIAAGTVTEATVFRLAQFDAIDYFNQNLGAVLAGLAAIQVAARSKPSDVELRSMIATGAIFLVIGGYFAVT